MMKRMIFLVLSTLLATDAISQDTIPIKYYYLQNFVFGSGYWVYQDTVNNDIDSISLVSCMHNAIAPNPIYDDYQEYFLMDYYSHSYDCNFNDYIIDNRWTRNGGGQYGELGQPIMHVGQFDIIPEVGNGFNGYEIMDIFDSLEIHGNVFYNVVWSRVEEDQQYQYEFIYDTDLYFAPGTGIDRKEYTDILGTTHVWDLVNWLANIYTGVSEDLPMNAKATVYPNPAHEKITIQSDGMQRLELIDLMGNVINTFNVRSDKCAFDVKVYSQGVYFIKVITNEGNIVEKIVIK